jgi:hypothetical protein
MPTTWTEQLKNLVDQGITYNEAGITYNQVDIQYGGQSTVVWTEQPKS